MNTVKQGRENPFLGKFFRKPMNTMVKEQHNFHIKMKNIPENNEISPHKNNILETEESPNSRGEGAKTNYYGTYSKVPD